MKPHERYIIYGLALILLCVIGYGVYTYNERETRKLDIDETISKKELLNDSLRLEIAKLEAEKKPYVEANEQEARKRTEFETSRKKKQDEIYKNNTDINKRFNDSVITNYRSKYR